MAEDIFSRLNKSKFRSSFRLKGRELEYFESKGINEILSHARDFINSRLAPADIPNDGKQTLSQWGMIFAAIILGMFAVIRLRRKASE